MTMRTQLFGSSASSNIARFARSVTISAPVTAPASVAATRSVSPLPTPQRRTVQIDAGDTPRVMHNPLFRSAPVRDQAFLDTEHTE